MSDFWIYFHTAWRFILDIKGYQHILFLIALMAPYAFKDWKPVLILITTFAIGEIVAMVLSVVGVLMIKTNFYEFLIPATIVCIASFNIITIGKSQKSNSTNWIALIVLLFGIVHGLVVSNSFNSISKGKLSDKILPLFEFITGILAAQVCIVFLILVLSYTIQNFFKFSKRDFILTFSSFVIGVALPIIVKNVLLN